MKKSILSLLCVASLSFATTFEDGTKAFESKDYKTALKVFEEFSLKGDASAQNNLGSMYYYGEGVEKDSKKAKKLFKEACDGGHQDSCKLI